MAAESYTIDLANGFAVAFGLDPVTLTWPDIETVGSPPTLVAADPNLSELSRAFTWLRS